MSVEQLVVSSFRNINQAKLVLHPKINFLYGNNGSGKTSLLESVFYLAHGKSFRTTSLGRLVANAEDSLVIFVKDTKGNSLGIQRDKNQGVSLRVNGIAKQRLSELAKYLVVQVMTPESFKLFFGGPKERRKFVDLGLFHVEHNFGNLWQSFNKVLKHRNALLRQKVNQDDTNFVYWSGQFVELSDRLTELRVDYIKKLKQELMVWIRLLLPDIESAIDLSLFNGWSSSLETGLTQVLNRSFDRERRYGYSVAGAQKFDLLCTYNKEPIEQILSRGQQKLFLISLVFAQSNLVATLTGNKPLVLIDDIGAELDDSAKVRFATAIGKIDSQLLITAINEDAISNVSSILDNYKMFHVEHGVISEN